MVDFYSFERSKFKKIRTEMWPFLVSLQSIYILAVIELIIRDNVKVTFSYELAFIQIYLTKMLAKAI